MKERPQAYGTHGGLVGVLCEPDGGAAPGTPGFLFFNIGLNHRVGPQRVQVEAARALAERGFASLRFDLSGLGDSEARSDSRSEEERALLDLGESMDLLNKRCGLTQFVVVGLCSGVDPTYAVSRADPRVVGAVHIDGYAWPDAGYERRKLKARLLRLLERDRWQLAVSRRWRKLQGLKVDVDKETAGAEPIFDRTYPPMEDFRAVLQGFVERQMSLLFLYSGQAYFFDQKDQFLSMLGWSELPPGVEVEFWPESDHVFTTGAMRNKLVTRVVRWAVERYLREMPSGQVG